MEGAAEENTDDILPDGFGSCFVVLGGMTSSVTFGSRNFSVWSKDRSKLVIT